MKFPIYLKYTNDRNFFIVHSETEWEEYSIAGRSYFYYKKTAKIFPDRMFVLDLLENSYRNVERMGEEEFIETIGLIKRDYKEKRT